MNTSLGGDLRLSVWRSGPRPLTQQPFFRRLPQLEPPADSNRTHWRCGGTTPVDRQPWTRRPIPSSQQRVYLRSRKAIGPSHTAVSSGRRIFSRKGPRPDEAVGLEFSRLRSRSSATYHAHTDTRETVCGPRPHHHSSSPTQLVSSRTIALLDSHPTSRRPAPPETTSPHVSDKNQLGYCQFFRLPEWPLLGCLTSSIAGQAALFMAFSRR
ncbi:hypothetical protein BT67DRAFT_211531 [Trichocladium antarcticum]|uniref:Uncharacterized protein n=1 Tax=Trichocladium antarcticum TaxID=1450529 RepID=A0AAN6ZAH7_9PEZI|nr:hypothetical protein BT67DRAFT_211531 [Trichocladium antarcticum]